MKPRSCTSPVIRSWRSSAGTSASTRLPRVQVHLSSLSRGRAHSARLSRRSRARRCASPGCNRSRFRAGAARPPRRSCSSRSRPTARTRTPCARRSGRIVGVVDRRDLGVRGLPFCPAIPEIADVEVERRRAAVRVVDRAESRIRRELLLGVKKPSLTPTRRRDDLALGHRVVRLRRTRRSASEASPSADDRLPGASPAVARPCAENVVPSPSNPSKSAIGLRVTVVGDCRVIVARRQ